MHFLHKKCTQQLLSCLTKGPRLTTIILIPKTLLQTIFNETTKPLIPSSKDKVFSANLVYKNSSLDLILQ